MLNQIDFSIANLGLACGVLSGLSLLYYYVKFALHEWRIRKIGGVRAPRLAYTPIGGAIPFPYPKHIIVIAKTCRTPRTSGSESSFNLMSGILIESQLHYGSSDVPARKCRISCWSTLNPCSLKLQDETRMATLSRSRSGRARDI